MAAVGVLGPRLDIPWVGDWAGAGGGKHPLLLPLGWFPYVLAQFQGRMGWHVPPGGFSVTGRQRAVI